MDSADCEQDWKISPMLATNMADLAPALVHTAELDPLRDEGEAYARKLEEGGNRVEVVRVSGVPHTFPVMDGILKGAIQYNEKVLKVLQRELQER